MRKKKHTTKYPPSHTILPTFPSSPRATSHTTSPTLNNLVTPAPERRNSASHSSTLLSDSQVPSGEGRNTRKSTERFGRRRGERNFERGTGHEHEEGGEAEEEV